MTLMVTVVGVILLFGIGMLAFLSSTKTTKKKATAEAVKPNLGRIQTGSAPGDLIPSNKVKSSPEEATTEPVSIRATSKEPRHRRRSITNADQFCLANGQEVASNSRDIPKFEEPDTNPNGAGKSSPPPYGSSNASDQEAAKREEEELSKPSIVFTAHRQMDARKGDESAPRTDQQSRS